MLKTLLAKNEVFDEQPNMENSTEDIDFRVASELFTEIGTSFRVTIYNKLIKEPAIPEWHQELLTYLKKNKEIATQKAAELWDTSDRTARTRMRKLVDAGILAEIGSSQKDPRKIFVLKQ